MRVLYVVDPGPDGSLGDTSWIVEARRSRARLPTLIVQGVVMNELTAAADIVLPGAAWVEKDALYTNDQGTRAGRVARHRAARRGARGLADPGRTWGGRSGCRSATSPRTTCAGRSRRPCRTARTPPPNGIAFARPVSARHWLQASNPSERWKWDFMYQDLPPVKGHNVQMEGLQNLIPLKPIG